MNRTSISDESDFMSRPIGLKKLKMQEMHCILLVFYIGATFFCAREAWEMLYFTCIYTTGGARQNDGGYSNDIFPRFFRQRDVRKFGPCQSAHHGGGRAKMTEATQATFSRDFFGKEMSENSGLV